MLALSDHSKVIAQEALNSSGNAYFALNNLSVGGHLLEAHVRPTLEVIMTEAAEPLQRRQNPEVGLPLLEP